MSDLNKERYINAVMDYIAIKGSDLTLNVIYNIGCWSFIEIVGHVVDYNAVPPQVESLFDPDLIISFYDKHEKLIIDHFEKQMTIEGGDCLASYLSTIPLFKWNMMCEEFFDAVLSKDKEAYHAIKLFHEVAYWHLLEEICMDFNEYCIINDIDIKAVKHDFEQYKYFS